MISRFVALRDEINLFSHQIKRKKQKFMLCCFHTLSRGRDGKSWTWFCSRMSRLTSHISHHPVLFRWSAFYSQSDWCRCRSDYTLLTNCARCHSASLITDSIGEWRHRLQCVVDQNGGHTEHVSQPSVLWNHCCYRRKFCWSIFCGVQHDFRGNYLRAFSNAKFS